MLVVALALSDLLMINTMAPPLFINVFMSRWWAFGEAMCNPYGFLGGVFGKFIFLIHSLFLCTKVYISE